MAPYVVRGSDAVQNVTESLLAARLVGPGIYLVLHGQVLTFPGIRKDYKSQSFRKEPGDPGK